LDLNLIELSSNIWIEFGLGDLSRGSSILVKWTLLLIKMWLRMHHIPLSLFISID